MWGGDPLTNTSHLITPDLLPEFDGVILVEENRRGHLPVAKQVREP